MHIKTACRITLYFILYTIHIELCGMSFFRQNPLKITQNKIGRELQPILEKLTDTPARAIMIELVNGTLAYKGTPTIADILKIKSAITGINSDQSISELVKNDLKNIFNIYFNISQDNISGAALFIDKAIKDSRTLLDRREKMNKLNIDQATKDILIRLGFEQSLLARMGANTLSAVKLLRDFEKDTKDPFFKYLNELYLHITEHILKNIPLSDLKSLDYTDYSASIATVIIISREIYDDLRANNIVSADKKMRKIGKLIENARTEYMQTLKDALKYLDFFTQEMINKKLDLNDPAHQPLKNSYDLYQQIIKDPSFGIKKSSKQRYNTILYEMLLWLQPSEIKKIESEYEKQLSTIEKEISTLQEEKKRIIAHKSLQPAQATELDAHIQKLDKEISTLSETTKKTITIEIDQIQTAKDQKKQKIKDSQEKRKLEESLVQLKEKAIHFAKSILRTYRKHEAEVEQTEMAEANKSPTREEKDNLLALANTLVEKIESINYDDPLVTIRMKDDIYRSIFESVKNIRLILKKTYEIQPKEYRLSLANKISLKYLYEHTKNYTKDLLNQLNQKTPDPSIILSIYKQLESFVPNIQEIETNAQKDVIQQNEPTSFFQGILSSTLKTAARSISSGVEEKLAPYLAQAETQKALWTKANEALDEYQKATAALAQAQQPPILTENLDEASKTFEAAKKTYEQNVPSMFRTLFEQSNEWLKTTQSIQDEAQKILAQGKHISQSVQEGIKVGQEIKNVLAGEPLTEPLKATPSTDDSTTPPQKESNLGQTLIGYAQKIANLRRSTAYALTILKLPYTTSLSLFNSAKQYLQQMTSMAQ